MTLNKYLSNATSGGTSPRQAYNMLVSEFRKGNVSYPRTDAEHHAPLEVLQPSYINNQVKQWIEKEPEFTIQDLDEDNFLVKGDPFILNEYLSLSTPSSVVNDYERCCKLKYKEEKNKFVGIEHRNYENELHDERVELVNFSFQDIILEAVSFELDVPETELEINFIDRY